jgi:hypothetical protein
MNHWSLLLLEFTNPLLGDPHRTHCLQGFHYSVSRIRCLGNAFVFSNLLPGDDSFFGIVLAGTWFLGRCSATNVWLWLHYSTFQPSRHNIIFSFSSTYPDGLDPLAFPTQNLSEITYLTESWLLGHVISPSQGRYIHKTTRTQKNAGRHPCLDWDSSPRFSGRRHFVSYAARPLDWLSDDAGLLVTAARLTRLRLSLLIFTLCQILSYILCNVDGIYNRRFTQCNKLATTSFVHIPVSP